MPVRVTSNTVVYCKFKKKILYVSVCVVWCHRKCPWCNRSISYLLEREIAG